MQLSKNMLMIIAVIAVAAVVVVAAVALSAGGNDNGNGGDDDDDQYTMKNGDFIEYQVTTEDEYGEEVINYKWQVSNVTASGYDVLTTLSGDGMSYSFSSHVDGSDAPMMGAYSLYWSETLVFDTYPGVTAEDMTLTTPLGSKAVRHYQVTVEDDEDESLEDTIDIYVGKSNGVLYKWVTIEKEDGVVIMTTTFEIFDSNIAVIGSNPDNDDDDDGHQTSGTSAVVVEDGVITITGMGNAVTDTFELAAGVSIVEMYYPGEEMTNFIVEIYSSEDMYDLVVNEIGAYDGTRLVDVSEDNIIGLLPGEQYVEVTATGAWTIVIEQPRPASADEPPLSLSGSGDDVLEPFFAPNAELLFEFTHDGEDDIIVNLYDNEGNKIGNLANVQGEQRDSYSLSFDGLGFNPSSGIFWIEVIADGNWTIDITVEE